MKFIEKMKSLFVSPGGTARRGIRTYVVDAARLVDEKTGRRMPPREQVQILNALARVAKQENLVLQAVLESERALREVEDGGEYNGVRVFFAPDGEQLVATALKLCRKSDGVLVSSGVTMESRATEAGIPVLCSSTFRKAFLQGGAPGGNGDRGERGERSDRGGDRGTRGGGGGRRGRDRRRERSPNGGSRPGGTSSPSSENESRPAPEEAGQGGDDNSAVRNLIDLVE